MMNQRGAENTIKPAACRNQSHAVLIIRKNIATNYHSPCDALIKINIDCLIQQEQLSHKSVKIEIEYRCNKAIAQPSSHYTPDNAGP